MIRVSRNESRASISARDRSLGKYTRCEWHRL